MDPAAIETHARALGFGRALDLFRDDVIEAARRAALQRAQLDPPDDPACEPWPPMQCAPPSR
ncbi:hypothetical protein [Beijerinckia sp. L45]|uniref:hypothetical protein n=1 Tax=Beijerinckia sp. L45 TaxID=1641855 RepID=UPI00131C07E1|nr:hypothetical protein [Beijerinckia sp. L45]